MSMSLHQGYQPCFQQGFDKGYELGLQAAQLNRLKDQYVSAHKPGGPSMAGSGNEVLHSSGWNDDEPEYPRLGWHSWNSEGAKKWREEAARIRAERARYFEERRQMAEEARRKKEEQRQHEEEDGEEPAQLGYISQWGRV